MSKKEPVFPQMERLTNERWFQRRDRRPQRETSLDEIFTPDGVPTRKDDDEEA